MVLDKCFQIRYYSTAISSRWLIISNIFFFVHNSIKSAYQDYNTVTPEPNKHRTTIFIGSVILYLNAYTKYSRTSEETIYSMTGYC